MKQDIRALLEIMERLRHPENGCPWDLEQTFATIAPYTVEEAYEVADAIEREDMDALRDELGDLLLQVVYHSKMASEQGEFGWGDVVAAVCDKMVRRHPHVFGAQAEKVLEATQGSPGADTPARPSGEQRSAWEDTKERERSERGVASLLDEIPRGMAELQRALKLQSRAARVGFDWSTPLPVLEKLDEEVSEVRAAIDGGDTQHVEEEIGDLLFVVVNLARKLDLDPGAALRRANAKFERRFRAVEQAAGDRTSLDRMSLDDMEALWVRVKEQEGVVGHE